jgi:hydrogenase maturation protein HypF
MPPSTLEKKARRIHINGVVQGVGFRPFVYGLATRYQLFGWVCNTSAGVDIEVEGPEDKLQNFIAALTAEAPPLARIEELTVQEIPVDGYDEFTIRHSQAKPGAFQPISPDICICDDCLQELFDPSDRRFRYPFINCTNCGPRFTIIQDIPYDRPKTTMAPFQLCPACQAEYDDPLNRRFHAQPNACPECGPSVELWVPNNEPDVIKTYQQAQALKRTRALLNAGQIVAVKGLGGFHLACDATNDQALSRLRERKGRIDKPFALMAFDLETVKSFCHVSPEEEDLLTSRERPIVLLREKPDSPISSLAAPGIRDLGVMLPYTPLHYLLLEPDDRPMILVMTSGNYSEEPIAVDNREARERLSKLADAFLLHNRDIHARCDDSVSRIVQGTELPLRRSRGYAPYPVHLPFPTRQILAVGAELKNTFCLTKERYAFLSQHIGDMENYETLRSFETTIEQLTQMFRVEPEVVAYDMHPGYLSTKYALQRSGIPEQIAVQHHHAHIAGGMAEHGLEPTEQVIGVAFDGTGYGTDGAIWGGEFLIASYSDFRRVAHLAYVPLPGGDAAIKRPYRVALAHLWAAGLSWSERLAPVQAASAVERGVLTKQIEQSLNTVPTSSMGRLFDAVSAIAGVRQEVTYEAQAAIELEMLVDPTVDKAYEWKWTAPPATSEEQPAAWQIQAGPVIKSIIEDVKAGVPVAQIAAGFHNSVADLVSQTCHALRERTGLDQVVLSGGVWQNVTLLDKTLHRLHRDNFTVYTHRLVPPNDGGLSLGQAVVANFKSQASESK